MKFVMQCKSMSYDVDEHVCGDYVDDDGVVVYHRTANIGVVLDLDNCHWQQWRDKEASVNTSSR